jgi:hypothetical protein
MFKVWYNILVSNGVRYCVHDFNLSKFISSGGRLAEMVSLFVRIKRRTKRGKYRKGRAIHIMLLSVTTSIFEGWRT